MNLIDQFFDLTLNSLYKDIKKPVNLNWIKIFKIEDNIIIYPFKRTTIKYPIKYNINTNTYSKVEKKYNYSEYYKDSINFSLLLGKIKVNNKYYFALCENVVFTLSYRTESNKDIDVF